jgi:hypothetical protein
MKTILRRARRLLLLAATVFLFGNVEAAPPRDHTPRGVWIGSRSVDFQTLDSGLHGPWTKPALILIRNPSEWYAAMDRAGAMHPVPPPAIDWSKYAVVLAVLGEQPVLGYGIEITQALRHGQDLLLKVDVELPDVQNPTQNFTSPYHIVQVETWRSMGVKAEYNAVVPDIDTDQPRPRKRGRSPDAGNVGGESVLRTTWSALKGRFAGLQ